MINLSEMYRISGGGIPNKDCEECENFVEGKINQCLLYPNDTKMNWNGKRMACKFFYNNPEPYQRTVMNYLKENMDD